ncbi:MAG TPA: HAD family phosphatase [Chloroflexota bacterium]|nr:HAD family phosphatase [Chloroflexota bacterium]
MEIAVLWDLDGTLADTEQAHFSAWQALVRGYGRELTWDEFKPTFGLGNPDILHMLVDPALEQPELERLSQHKEQLFRDETGGSIAAMPGALALVAHLQRLGVPQAIASSAPVENITFILRALDLEGAFATAVSRWQVPNGKPFPDIFLRAAANLGVPPGQCVVLEDAPAGVQAAHAAGMRCIALVSTWPEEALAGADLLVRDLSTVRWPRERWEAFATRAV